MVCNCTWGTKIVLFGEMSSGLMKQKYNFLAIMTIIMFGGKGGGLQAEEHHPNREALGWQHHVVGLLCCRRDRCSSQNRWHHEVGKLCGYTEHLKTSVRKLNLGSSKWTMTPSILPKLWQNSLRTTKSRYWSDHHKALTSIP